MQRHLKHLLCGTMALGLIIPGSASAQMQTQQRPGMTRPAARPDHQRPTRPHRPPRPNPPPRPTPVRPGPPHGNRPIVQPIRPPHGNRPIVQPGRPVHRPGYRPTHIRRIHAAVFHYPRGYYYRRWVTGLILPHIFLSSAYYYDHWYDLGFGPPPHGYRWVRYGPDLLLVNVHTGHIADVAYGVFY